MTSQVDLRKSIGNIIVLIAWTVSITLACASLQAGEDNWCHTNNKI